MGMDRHVRLLQPHDPRMRGVGRRRTAGGRDAWGGQALRWAGRGAGVSSRAVSDEKDVRTKWGEPAKVLERHGDTHWFYPPDVAGSGQLGPLRRGHGRVKEIAFNHGLAAEKPRLADFVKRYGKPDVESEHSHHSAWSRVLIFKKAGVELVVQKGDDQVLVENYVAPSRCPVMTWPEKNPYTM